jgi:centromeric protein E
LEAEKSSIQTNLDAVLELATQQKVSFNEEYEEVSYVKQKVSNLVTDVYCKLVPLSFRSHLYIL